MRNVLLVALCGGMASVGGALPVQANPITSITISLPANPDANTTNWGTSLTIVATAGSGPVAGRVDPAIANSRVLATVRQGGKKVCGSYTATTAPAAGFATTKKEWRGGDATSLLGKGCILPAGEYEFVVQIVSGKENGGAPLSEEVVKAFRIRGSEQQRK